MYKGVIFDLDMTLVNTNSLFDLRKNRQWSKVYNRINETFLFDGIESLIEKLSNRYQLGIVTSSPASYASRVIKYHNIKIPLLVAYHDTRMHKPHPEPIKLGVKKLGLKPSEVVSIGDEKKDIIASNEAGVTSVAITWGLDKKKILKEANPDKLCETTKEIRKFMKELH